MKDHNNNANQKEYLRRPGAIHISNIANNNQNSSKLIKISETLHEKCFFFFIIHFCKGIYDILWLCWVYTWMKFKLLPALPRPGIPHYGSLVNTSTQKEISLFVPFQGEYRSLVLYQSILQFSCSFCNFSLNYFLVKSAKTSLH